MKITILNGNPYSENIEFDNYLSELTSILKNKSHSVTLLLLRDMDLKYCTGCWSCWAKTPGECIVHDASHDIDRECINSDFVLFASPVIMGFTSALLKKAQDKMIPLILPYLDYVNGEYHHEGRYSKYPVIGLLLEKGNDCDDEDIEIIENIYKREAINFRTRFSFTKFTSEPLSEVADEFNNI